MKFHVLTLFPDMIEEGCNNSILKRAGQKGLVQIQAIDIRSFTADRHGKVDDYTYGGGAGMLMQAQPVYDCWKSVSGERKIRTVYLTPQGKTLTQSMVKELALQEEMILLCGHYEGIDERVLDEIVTDRISIGDYVLTGGELPALVLIDAVSRLIPGVLGSEESAGEESFERDLLEYPQYSRPEVWHDKRVPEVLLTGDHKKISAWRLQEAEERTKLLRPDLYARYQARQELLERLGKHKKENAYFIDGLMRDEVEVLFAKEEAAIGMHRKTRVAVLCCDTVKEAEELLTHLPKDCSLLLHNCEESISFLQEEYGFSDADACYQSVYTQHNALYVSHKDIRPYPMSEAEYAVKNYEDGNAREYIEDRIRNHELFAAYEDDRIVGFSGVHSGGSLGILFVDPAYRRGNLGTSLAAYLVNIALQRGGLPYAHIRLHNTASLKMQEKMGLYVGSKKVFWMYRDLNGEAKN